MLAIARELRTTLWIADALSELGQDLVAAGELAEGARRLAEAIDAAPEAVQFTVRPGIALTELALRAGRPAEALEHLTRLAPVAPQFAVYVLDARRAEGEALVALGRRGEAEARLREVTDRSRGARRPAGRLARESRAGAAPRRAGRRDEARAARADARRSSRRSRPG